jgi:hypothetical protein
MKRICPECEMTEGVVKFYKDATCCQDCNEHLAKSAMELLKAYYKPSYPAHIQAYLDERNKKLDSGIKAQQLAQESRNRLKALLI